MLALGEKVAVLERFFLVFLSLGSQHGRRGTVLFTYDLILIPAFSNPRMSLKSVRVEKGRLQGENLLSERIEMFERGGGQGGGGS